MAVYVYCSLVAQLYQRPQVNLSTKTNPRWRQVVTTRSLLDLSTEVLIEILAYLPAQIIARLLWAIHVHVHKWPYPVANRCMDTDINDIWDLPVETSISHLPADTLNRDGSGNTPPSRASSGPLFLPSDDDEDTTTAAGAGAGAEPRNQKNADIDALFEGLDDMDGSFQELGPSLDLDVLRREADAQRLLPWSPWLSLH